MIDSTLSKREALAANHKSAQEGMPGDSVQILVVDDHKPTRQLIIAHLESVGYNTASAADGVEAWHLLRREPDRFDVILLDRRMPNMDGMELLSRIKGDPSLSDIPVIMETAADSQQDIIDVIHAGTYYYLSKPIEREHLLAITSAAIDDVARLKNLQSEVQKRTNALSVMYSGFFRFQTLFEANNLAVTLAGACPNASYLVVGLSELMINAVEHGNLGISFAEKSRLIAEKSISSEIKARLSLPENMDKFATLQFQRTEEWIEFIITDQGSGFNWRRYLEFSPKLITKAHGRGIALASKISFDTIEYFGCGNRVKATVFLSGGKDREVAPAAKGSTDPHEAGQEEFRQRLDDELAVARTMQEDLLPDSKSLKTLGARYGMNLSAYFETSSELGGDMWGLRPLDRERMGLYVVDFSGHGISAAINTFRLHTLIRDIGAGIGFDDPADVLRELNASLVEILPLSQFATMLYGIIDTKRDSFRYATAAAPLPMLSRVGSEELIFGKGSGLPLGISLDAVYESQEIDFRPGDLLFLYSDAATESRQTGVGRVGKDGLAAMVKDASRRLGEKISAEAILELFFARVERPLADDLTVVCCVRAS